MLFTLLDLTRDWLMEVGLYRFVMVLDQVSFRALFATLLSFTLVLAFGRPVIRWLTAKKIGDLPRFDVAALDRAMASKANTPTMGGLLIAGAIAVSTLLLADLANRYVQLALIVILWMAAVGGADDWLKLTISQRAGGSRQGLRTWEKLVFQLGLGLVIGFFAFRYGAPQDPEAPAGLAHSLTLPLLRTYDPQTFMPEAHVIYLGMGAFIVLSMLMIAGMSNAVNITDGMDGLATGITAAVSLALVILCLIAGSQTTAQELLMPYIPLSGELAVVCGAMAGAALGFLWWNCAPASVFMGDTGSLCLGGIIGYVAIVIRQEAIVLLMCGVFVLEIGTVVLQIGYFKASRGKRVFRCAPYHWHLHMGGMTEQKIVARFWIVTIVLIALALASIRLR